MQEPTRTLLLNADPREPEPERQAQQINGIAVLLWLALTAIVATVLVADSVLR